MADKAANPTSARAYDIVVFGATGFTGKLTAEYLVQSKEAGKLKIAIAGRNAPKLEACKQALLALSPKYQSIYCVPTPRILPAWWKWQAKAKSSLPQLVLT